MNTDKLLAQFLTRTRATLGDALDSLILYGSAARDEFDPGFSDLNLLLLVTHTSRPLLAQLAPVLHWWAAQGQPQPLLMTRHELLTATDAFPIELYDLTQSQRLLHGSQPLPPITIPPLAHRLQLEHEARSSLLRLRMKSIPLLYYPPQLLRLLEDSLPTFLLLARHALLLKGLPAPYPRRDILAAAAAAHLLHPAPFLTLLDLREKKAAPRSVNPVQLFEDYLTQVESLVTAIDNLTHQS